jgi:hypothetical protein
MFSFSRLEKDFNNLDIFRAAELTRANTQKHSFTGLLKVYNFDSEH